MVARRKRDDKNMNQQILTVFGLGLFDSGVSSTLINKRLLHMNVIPIKGRSQRVTTTQETYDAEEYVEVDLISFPDFTSSRKFEKRGFMVFDSPHLRYDVIIGRDLPNNGFIPDHQN